MSDFGKSLIKARVAKKVLRCNIYSQKSRGNGPRPTEMASITDRNDLDEFLAVAEMSGKSFSSDNTLRIASDRPKDSRETTNLDSFSHWLRMPRRPVWHKSTTAEELHKMEQESFLQWRRTLAQIENNDNFAMTPFERNLEMWRQLWRVMEMSDVVVQIVDARNPLLFFCEDVFSYARELGASKQCILLLNKSDLLGDDLMRYFGERGICSVFYSALLNQPSEDGPIVGKRADIADSLELMQLLSTKGKAFGFVGYPNVGKSSTINSILKEKRVSVSATPGKTKHYQSFLLAEGVKILDCPGLVFPNITHSKEDLIINGILPVDQMKDHVSPIRKLLQHVSREQIEDLYRVSLPKPSIDEEQGRSPTAAEVLETVALARGFRTSVFGNPDTSRVARIILKDFIKARLLYCNPPPKASK